MGPAVLRIGAHQAIFPSEGSSAATTEMAVKPRMPWKLRTLRLRYGGLAADTEEPHGHHSVSAPSDNKMFLYFCDFGCMRPWRCRHSHWGMQEKCEGLPQHTVCTPPRWLDGVIAPHVLRFSGLLSFQKPDQCPRMRSLRLRTLGAYSYFSVAAPGL